MASSWNNEDVVRFVESTLETNKYNDSIRSSQIDGSTLLHMNANLWKDEFAIEPLHKRLKLDARVKELATAKPRGSPNAGQHPNGALHFSIPETRKEVIINKVEPILHEIIVNKQAEFTVENTKPQEPKNKVPAVTAINNKASTGNAKSQEQTPKVTKAIARAREINKQSNRVDLTDVYGDDGRPTYERAIRKSFLAEHHPELHSTCKINQDHVRSWCCAHRGFMMAENDKEKLRSYCREVVYKHFEEIHPYVFKQDVTYYWDPEDIVKFMEQWKYEQARYKVRRAAKGGESTYAIQKHEDEEEGNSVSVQERTTLSTNDCETPNLTRVDWVETPDAHVFKADIPGVSKEEVKIEVDEGPCLQIRGERRKEDRCECDMWHRVERFYGGFLRKFKLPEFTNVDGIKAEVNNGVLTVTIPKVPKPRPRTIKVE